MHIVLSLVQGISWKASRLMMYWRIYSCYHTICWTGWLAEPEKGTCATHQESQGSQEILLLEPQFGNKVTWKEHSECCTLFFHSHLSNCDSNNTLSLIFLAFWWVQKFNPWTITLFVELVSIVKQNKRRKIQSFIFYEAITYGGKPLCMFCSSRQRCPAGENKRKWPSPAAAGGRE